MNCIRSLQYIGQLLLSMNKLTRREVNNTWYQKYGER